MILLFISLFLPITPVSQLKLQNKMMYDMASKMQNEQTILSQIHSELKGFGFLDYDVTDIWWRTTLDKPHLRASEHISNETQAEEQQTEKFREQPLPGDLPEQQVEGLPEQPIPGDPPEQQTEGQPDHQVEDPAKPQTEGLPEQQTGGNLQQNTENLPEQQTEELPRQQVEEPSEQQKPDQFNTTEPVTIANDTANMTTEQYHELTNITSSSNVSQVANDTSLSPFIQQLYTAMEKDNHGGFTAFFVEFLKLLVIKDYQDVILMIKAFQEILNGTISSITETGLDENEIQRAFIVVLEQLETEEPEIMHRRVAAAYFILKNGRQLAESGTLRTLYYLDQIYTKSDVLKLFKTLEEFNNYPKGGKFAQEVTQDICRAILAPFSRMYKSRDLNVIMRHMNKAYLSNTQLWIEKHQLHHMSPSTDINIQGDETTTDVPQRRQMVHESIYKPKIFQNSGKHRKRSRYIYHKPHDYKTHHQTPHNEHKVRRQHTHGNNRRNAEILKDEYNHIRFPGLKWIRKNNNIKRFYISPLTTTSYSITNGMTGRSKTTQKNKKNKNVAMREMTRERLPKVFTQSSVDKKVLRKIIQVSSYSDEEEFLRMNLYNGLRQ